VGESFIWSACGETGRSVREACAEKSRSPQDEAEGTREEGACEDNSEAGSEIRDGRTVREIGRQSASEVCGHCGAACFRQEETECGRRKKSRSTGSPIGMANQQGSFINVIDVGSSKTCALVAEITENGLRYRGHGVAESRGSRKGVIVDLEKAVSSIQKAVEGAEDTAGAPVEHALVGVAGSHVRGLNTHGGVTFGTRPREIARDEIRQAVDKARGVQLPADREILHLLPQEFILDEQPGVHDPLGMMAARLEVRVHMVTSASSATQNVVTAVNRAGVHVDDTIFEPLACADAVLRSDERDLGVCLADVGAGST
jgi:hypothetical protein